MLKDFDIYKKSLDSLPEGRLLITTINAHSYNVSREDAEFKQALLASDVLIPDGISVVWAVKLLAAVRGKQQVVSNTKTLKKIAGEDLFYWEMKRLQQKAESGKQQEAKAMFLGSSEAVLAKIKARAAVEFPNVEVHTYSPPYKPEFSDEDNRAMYAAIEAVQPDVLFVGMTAPKQEKWAHQLVKSGQWTVNNYQLSTIHYPLSTINYPLSTIHYQLISMFVALVLCSIFMPVQWNVLRSYLSGWDWNGSTALLKNPAVCGAGT